METRLRASEHKAETMETRMRASEIKRAVIKKLKEKQEEQAEAVRAIGGGLNLTVSHVEELRREREERRVSFSASLVTSGSETFGPFSGPTTLIYRHVFTNTGNAYNPNTGVFTAPVRGVYYFAVFVFGHGHALTAVSLQKNEEHVVIATVTSHSHQPSHRVDTSNVASLLLEVGDVGYVNLCPKAWVYDSYNHLTTLSGHLLFPM
ncbi:complement C1q-like protein 2 [Clupea harengus]|uniref:Complement C1q-like protein 2 n=1 Tax=Clupea harengus TaxID=7950 RepID=A0A8M1KS21_CLUHA|nr:complement C1q-like protein 2 [Clupea harengus]